MCTKYILNVLSHLIYEATPQSGESLTVCAPALLTAPQTHLAGVPGAPGAVTARLAAA